MSDSETDTTDTPMTDNTVVPRYIAATLDNGVAMLLAILAAKAVSAYDFRVLQAVVLIGVYLGYYYLPEALFARTPGKFITGLKVVDFAGANCSLSQTTIRTLFRVLEVNPLLFGALPAGLCVIFSAHRQRFGDRAAKTYVVHSR
jgi:uncharacterized RDD family membrane protein YckC